MIQSESIAELAKALVAAQSEFKPVAKKAKNPFYNSMYADLASVVEMASPILAKQGLSVTQFPDGEELTTVLMHRSGEWMRSSMRLYLAKLDPQGQGSAITYARRYAYSAALGLVTDEDDDGNAASRPGQSTRKPAAKAVNQQTGEVTSRPSPLAVVPEPGMVSSAQAKKELLLFFEGNGYKPLEAKAEAIRAWGNRESAPISRTALDELMAIYSEPEPPREEEGE